MRPTKTATKEWPAKVLSNIVRGGGYHVLSLTLPKSFPQPAGGNFLMLSVGNEPEHLLRRPMAFYDVRRKGASTTLDILYAVVGSGTAKMTSLKRGRTLSILGPIGNSFAPPKSAEKVSIVAGGVGIAPFLLWTRCLTPTQRKNVQVLLGFRSREQLAIARDFRRVGIQTKNAVEGPGGDYRGTVYDLFLREVPEFKPSRVLTCGPPILMDLVEKACKGFGVSCEVSLEAKMACGMGVCLSCVTSQTAGSRPGGYALVCQDGPIFVTR